ncbi:unnamed protein product [Urochloa decumbens]|uniref:DUF1618 domain-containing protein n=1 Tax=Urochloa decumbens TaxID=240449 RepID=A0ABC9CNL0_9POAL
MEEAAAAALAAALGAGGTWEKNPAAAAPYQSWALLDPTIIEEDPASNATAFAVCTASDDREVRVSLRLAEPPSSSYVQMRTDAEVYVKPRLLAADGDLILVHMVVAVVRDPPFTSLEDNLFVYKSRPGPAMGRLRLLPQLPDSAAPVRHTGIACRGQDFVVAGFHTRVIGDDEEMGLLSRFSSSTEKWDVLDLSIPFDPKMGLYKFVWGTDDKFAFEGLMFWVDYHRGMLYCDVFAGSPELQFIQLPGIDIWDQDHDYSQGRQLPQAYRTVGVSRGGLKFVDIDDGLFGTKKTSGFMITTWSLKLTDFKWVKDSVIQVDDLWSLPNFRDSPLPRWVPEYPVVSKKDSGIIHFILRGPQTDAKAWIITLDTRDEMLKSYTLFTNEQKLVFEDCDVDTKNIFLDTPFISCDFDHSSKSTAGRCFDTVEMKWQANLLPDFLEIRSESFLHLL